VLLDQFELQSTQATAINTAGQLNFDAVTATPLSTQFPEFVTLPDSLETWLPRLPQQLAPTTVGDRRRPVLVRR
jgi:hypothetical protein